MTLSAAKYYGRELTEISFPYPGLTNRSRERALKIASSISAGEFGIGLPLFLSDEINFRLFSELKRKVEIRDFDLFRDRNGTWEETKAIIELFEKSFADIDRAAAVLSLNIVQKSAGFYANKVGN